MLHRTVALSWKGIKKGFKVPFCSRVKLVLSPVLCRPVPLVFDVPFLNYLNSFLHGNCFASEVGVGMHRFRPIADLVAAMGVTGDNKVLNNEP